MGIQAKSAMSKTILIVEDNELNMKLFHDLLEAHGYGTVQAKDGMVKNAPAPWPGPGRMAGR